MIIGIRVYPGARKNLVMQDGAILKIHTTAPAADNKANAAVIKMLAEFYSVRKSRIMIKKGERSREKIIEIME